MRRDVVIFITSYERILSLCSRPHPQAREQHIATWHTQFKFGGRNYDVAYMSLASTHYTLSYTTGKKGIITNLRGQMETIE